VEVSENPIADISTTTSNPDSERPVLNSATASPQVLYTGGNVNLLISAGDSLSGISEICLSAYGLNDSSGIYNLNYNSSSGFWEGSLDLSMLEKYAMMRITSISISISIRDNAGNVRNYIPWYLNINYYSYYENNTSVNINIPVILILKNY